MEETASQSADQPVLGVGLPGYAFMGAAHSQAWRTAPRVFDLPLRPAMAALCGRDARAAMAAARRYGWAAAETDWRALIERDDVHLVDVCTPGDLHADIATGTDPVPSFRDGLQVQRVLAAVENSAGHESGWTPVPAT